MANIKGALAKLTAKIFPSSGSSEEDTKVVSSKQEGGMEHAKFMVDTEEKVKEWKEATAFGNPVPKDKTEREEELKGFMQDLKDVTELRENIIKYQATHEKTLSKESKEALSVFLKELEPVKATFTKWIERIEDYNKKLSEKVPIKEVSVKIEDLKTTMEKLNEHVVDQYVEINWKIPETREDQEKMFKQLLNDAGIIKGCENAIREEQLKNPGQFSSELKELKEHMEIINSLLKGMEKVLAQSKAPSPPKGSEKTDGQAQRVMKRRGAQIGFKEEVNKTPKFN